MTQYNKFIYGTGVLYNGTVLDPGRGPSTGGNSFVITGVSDFDPQTCDSEFTAALDPLKWTDISVGGGSISTGTSHLTMDIVPTGGLDVAGIRSVPTFLNCQGEVRAIIPKIIEYPSSATGLLNFMLFLNDGSNSYARLAVQLDATTLKLVCEVYNGVLLVDYYETEWTVGLSVFRILRWGGNVIFLANGVEIFRSAQFKTGAAYFYVFSGNLFTPVTMNVSNVVAEYFKYRPYVVFGDTPVPYTTVVSSRRVRGIVPPSVDNKGQSAAYSGDVDVSIVSDVTLTLSDLYEYYFEDSLTVLNSSQFGVKMSFIDDNQIATPSDTNKGL